MMRMLPRSAKGIWLLAAAVWVVACGLAWWHLPAQPRLTSTEPSARVLLEVGPAGRSLLVTNDDSSGRRTRRNRHVNLCDVLNHRSRLIPDFPDAEMEPIHVISPDGRWLFIAAKRRSKAQFRLVDIFDGSETPIAPDIGDDLAGCRAAIFSPNGDWLAFQIDGEKSDAIRLWDVRNNRPGPALPNAAHTMAFSADGKRLGTELFSSSHSPQSGAPERFAIWEVATGRNIAEESNRLDDWAWNVEALTPGNDGLIVSRNEPMDVSGAWIGPPPRELGFWDIANRRIRWSIHGAGLLQYTADRNQAVLTRHNRERRIDLDEVLTIDLATGEVKNCFPFSAGVIFALAPDARSYLFKCHESEDWGALRDWMGKQGLHWSKRADIDIHVVELSTGRRLLSLPNGRCRYTPDGESLVHLGSQGEISVWDLPPSKPLTGFALAAGVLALPLAGLAWRRSRRLRREVA